MKKNKNFNFGIRKGRRVALCVTLLSLGMLSGCGQDDMDALVLSKDTTYDGVEMDTTEVERGDISPVFEKLIELQGYEDTTYRVEKDKAEDLEYIYKAKLDKVNVSVGDHVHAGDTLVSFRSDNLNKELREKQNEKAEAVLEKEHLEKLMQIDSTLDFRDDIVSLNEDIRLAEIRIQDIQDTYNSMNIIAEKDGVVSYIDPSAQDGFLVVGSPIVTVSNDAGYYLMDLTEDVSEASGGDAEMTSTDVEFHVGDIYTAKSYMAEYKVEVIADPNINASETDASSEGAEAVYNGKVYLKMVDEDVMKEYILTLSIALPEQKNTLYVDRKAVISSDKGDFVYKQYDDEFIATRIVKGDEVGQYVIIKEGLEEGDVVSMSE